MPSPLGYVYSQADALKRRLYDMITNPSDYASMLGGRIQEGGQEREALMNQAFADQSNPLKITNEKALAALTDKIMQGEMGFAQAGVMDVLGLPNKGRDVIQSSAEDLSSKLKQLGFQADVTHSGSAAGPSSYVKVYDPQTGRFFNQPIRFSGHSKGSFNQTEVRDVNDPSVDLPKIIEDALAMRSQGPSKTFQKQAIADELIAGGMKPKQAYAQAEQRISGLLETQAGATSSAGMQNNTKKFLDMAEKGRLRMAKDRSAELRDLKEGKSNFAELSLNWDDPKTYDLVDEYAKEGFKTKVIDRGGRNITYLYKNEKDIEGVLSATTPADYGRAYGYSDEDIARFYLERGLGPKDFFEDMGFKGNLLD